MKPADTAWRGHARLWLDTEFNGWGGDLISLALVDDQGRQFYEVLECAEPQPWVLANVIPVLGLRPVSLGRMQLRLHQWLAAYRSVHVVADWPDDIAYFCRALITGPGERLDTPALSFEIRRDLDARSEIPHNALADARALRERHLWIEASCQTMAAELDRRLVQIRRLERAGELGDLTKVQNALSDAMADGQPAVRWPVTDAQVDAAVAPEVIEGCCGSRLCPGCPSAEEIGP